MSDGKGWIGGADHKRVRGLVARSANVIATAHDDLDQSSADIERIAGEKPKPKKRKPIVTLESVEAEAPPKRKSSKLKPPKSISSLERRLAARPKPDAGQHEEIDKPKPRGASAHRRAVFRQFLRSRDVGDVRSLGTLESLKDFDVQGDLEAQDDQNQSETEPSPKPARRRIIFRKRRAEMRTAKGEAKDKTAARDEEAPDKGLLKDDLFDRHLEAFDRAGNDHLADRNGDNLRTGWDRTADDRDDFDREGLDRSDLDRSDLEDDAEQQDAPWKGARFTHKPWQSDPEPEPDRRPSLFDRWTQQLDALSNAIVGLLIATLLAVSALGAGTHAPTAVPAAGEPTSDQGDARVNQPSVAATQTAHSEMQATPSTRTADPVAALLARTSLDEIEKPAPQAPLPSGFDIHAKTFPRPLPAMAADVSTMLSWARPSHAATPGIAVFPYMNLPQAVPGVPRDISGHIFMSTPQAAMPSEAQR